MREEWKEIEAYKGYKISNTGKVFSCKSNKMISQHLQNTLFGSAKGYYAVSLYTKQGVKTINVHRLVAMAFIPNPENKPQVHHKDNDPHNNNADNLEWVTIEEHAKHNTKGKNKK